METRVSWVSAGRLPREVSTSVKQGHNYDLPQELSENQKATPLGRQEMAIHSRVLVNQLQNERNFILSLVRYGRKMM